ncbi:radical SAM/SPASM domain-containing protein [Anaerosporobacter faecicola]|uniref:radical SAM/SPASM domain-containing protein n=1 Tax=Anaerosporobacter faecicola TaxID=2718714 RepID=UPI00143AE621|nr:radical SAM protein [Anaerosporobacter faecicola]
MFDKYRAKDIINTYAENYAQMKSIIEKKERGEIIEGDLLEPKGLLNIYVESTNRCNLSCIFCARENMSRELKSVSLESFCKTIDKLKKGSYISLNGNGEPLLNPQIYDMIEYASRKEMFVSIITNGTALTDKNIVKLANSGVSRVQISFQSLHKETYEKVLKGANFDRTIRQVLKFIKYVRENKKPVFITVGTVLVEEGKEYREVSKKFWNQMPIDNYYEGELLSLQSDSKEYGKLEDKKINEEYDICVNPWTSVKVNADGTVNPCSLDWSSKFVIGNINDNTLEEILLSEKAREFRKAVANADFEYLKNIGYDCRNCNTWTEELEYGMKSFLDKRFPIKLGLVIDEVAGERNSDLEYLNKVLQQLENDTFSINNI